MEQLLSPTLVAYVLLFMEPEQIQQLDAEPSWSDTTQRHVVAKVCTRLANDGKLDETYALIASALEQIEVPRDIHSEADRSRRCAMPTYIRLLLVRDLLACIASLKVACFAAQSSTWGISLQRLGEEAQRLVERRAATPPVPGQCMRMEIAPQAVALLRKAGLLVTHPTPCLFCQMHDGRCGCWQVTFPAETDFGEAFQTPYDHLRHSYSFTPTLPNTPDGWQIYLGYSGIWHPDRPWTLTVLKTSSAS